ncbi:MAG: tetratricopeptide repeat protein [Glaciecola sp.]|nr:tetratricopeptide repeat protein [Glaciecola sp.]
MKKAHTWFYGIALLIPVFVLLAVEGILRVSGYGNSHHLFIPVPNQPAYMQPNPDVIHRYFPSPEAAPNVAIDTQFFLAQKPTETLRIVAMGGSTAAGFPYGRFGAPAGILQHRLKGLYPERNIEVINVAMSSINSYMLRDFIDEVLEIEPDALYIYAGHNEYLGVMGVGSSYQGLGSHGLNLLYLSLKEWRIVQLIQALIVSVQASDGSSAESSAASSDIATSNSRTVMASIAKNQSIAFDSPAYMAGIEQFSDNLEHIVTQFSTAGLPVFLSTIASNDRDQAPFNSTYSLPESIEAELTAPSMSLAQLDTLYRQHSYHALVNYRYGQAVLANNAANNADNNIDNAHHFFTTARNLDGLRFRAPEHFNAMITDVAQQHANVHLVEGKKMLADASKDGIIGNALMLEHLHPNAKGYALLAHSALKAMIEQGLLPPAPYAQTQSIAEQHSQVSAADIIFAQHKINNLTSDYPFTSSPKPVPILTASDPAEQFGLNRIQKNDYLLQQAHLVNHYQQTEQWLLAANAASTLADGLPFNAQYANGAASLYRQAGSFDYAHFYALQAARLEPSNVNMQLNLAQIQFNKRLFEQAIATLQRVLKLQPNHPQAQQYLQQIQQHASSAS